MANHEREELEKGFDFTPDWDKIASIYDSVIPVIIQDINTKEVLALMYMDEKAFETSCRTKTLTLFSTTRKKIWVKGAEESGNTFEVISFRVNCEQNSLLCLVRQNKDGICHVRHISDGKPHRTCFYRQVISLRNPHELAPTEYKHFAKKKL